MSCKAVHEVFGDVFVYGLVQRPWSDEFVERLETRMDYSLVTTS
jgi:hypothetical protein